MRTLKLVPVGDAPASHWYLDSSSGPIEFETHETKQLMFSVSDLRPVTVVLSGFKGNQSLTVSVDDQDQFLTADSSGRLELQLPAVARVQVQENPQP